MFFTLHSGLEPYESKRDSFLIIIEMGERIVPFPCSLVKYGVPEILSTKDSQKPSTSKVMLKQNLSIHCPGYIK